MAESELSGALKSSPNSLHSDRSLNEVVVDEEAANRGVNINEVPSAASLPAISSTPGAAESASALAGNVVLVSAPDAMVVDGQQGPQDLVIDQLMQEAVGVVARENLKDRDMTEGELSTA
jgi:hypothetical protein